MRGGSTIGWPHATAHPACIYMDVDSIQPGQNFIAEIQHFIEHSDVLVVIIGGHWLVQNENGQRRIDTPNDFVRLEIEASLNRKDMAIIPVLVAGARMPRATDLPTSIQFLAHRNALEISDSSFELGTSKLIVAIESATSGTRHSSTSPSAAPARLRSIRKTIIDKVLRGAAFRKGYIVRLILTICAVLFVAALIVQSGWLFNKPPNARTPQVDKAETPDLRSNAQQSSLELARNFGLHPGTEYALSSVEHSDQIIGRLVTKDELSNGKCTNCC